MAESKRPEMISPLYSKGTGYAGVNSPVPGTFPDPLGYLSAQGNEAGWMKSAGGDAVNDWKVESPEVSGQK